MTELDFMSMTDEDFRGVIKDPKVYNNFKEVLSEGISFHEKLLDDYYSYLQLKSSRASTLFTVVTLVSLIALIQPGHGFIKQYLLFSLPFLLVSLGIFFYSERFVKSYSFMKFVVHGDPYEQLIYLRKKGKVMEEVWNDSLKNRIKLSNFHGVIRIGMALYLTSFAIFYYLEVFYTLPSICASLAISLVLVLLGVVYYKHPNTSVHRA